ncbi:hypothetical protein [Ramlibacter alkalitolerans]|uniref:Uncharacterized protein n=1 Tax=Ramlibacter alkalitolerans TaxID=2039631 RepID=A0ABS1JX01_9BURK|nr:hypothetical protein [Ramlibacter alkalitolerans]MBL0428727.1 hypothetical protein [Ramlibacter alkalitolerans]
MTPVHPIVEALLCRLDDNLREAFEERAGILQFEAGHPRDLAEALAMLEVIRTNPLAVSGVTHLRARIEGSEASVLAVNAASARDRITLIEGLPSDSVSLADAVKEIGSMGVLRPLPS